MLISSVKIYLFVFVLLLYLVYFFKRNIFLSYVRLNKSKLEKNYEIFILAMDARSRSNACLLISQRRVIARSMNVKSIPAVGADRESAVSDYKYASSRTSPSCATSFVGVVRITEASCKCINTLFAYAAGAKFWLAKVRWGGEGRGTVRASRQYHKGNITFAKKS